MPEQVTEQDNVSRELVIGILEDLQRIAEIEVPEIATVQDFQAFLVEHEITESLATAIHENSSPGTYFCPSISIGDNKYPQGTGYAFNALVNPEFSERVEKDGYKITTIRMYGKRNTDSGLFNFQYNLHLPIQELRLDGNYKLESRSEPDAWYKLTSTHYHVDFEANSGFGVGDRSADPSILPLVLKEATQDLYDAVKIFEKQKRVAQGVGKLI